IMASNIFTIALIETGPTTLEQELIKEKEINELINENLKGLLAKGIKEEDLRVFVEKGEKEKLNEIIEKGVKKKELKRLIANIKERKQIKKKIKILTEDIPKLIENLPELKVRQKWLISLSLLVCTVGIINSMLMAVTERSREIGTMKCLGALDRFVMELFLLEAMIHGIGGSILGGILGILIMSVIYIGQYKQIILTNFPLLQLLKYIGISILLGTGLAIIGALYPAIVSARMEPAEAIRREV
ncbi:MAG: FtsX-like permease family protein, partial [bacterium]|nr:FtsX-like permease family protein [bacterium]MDW8163431.1 FtsX-like permease family protein [Candidatus Omnitrophota bacterium]